MPLIPSLRVDYGDVASRYDANAVRSWIERDDRLAALPAGGADILDLACGTGTYLALQQSFFPSPHLRWHGLDESPAMLERARAKAPGATLRLGVAEQLPYPDASFDYVTTRFAFHHFLGKSAVIAEMRRVLRPGGTIAIFNIAPELSPQWWLYRFFPSAVAIDAQRFWSIAAIERAFAAVGLAAQTSVREIGEIAWALPYAEAHNRETSQLVLIDDDAYARGCAALRDAMPPNPMAKLDCGLSLVDIIARPTACA